MIFKLIKNELIKLLSRGKTWVVFGLFFVLIGGTIFLSYNSSKDSEYRNSPQGQIESLNKQIDYANERIKNAEKSTESWAQEEIINGKQQIEQANQSIKIQEDLLKNQDAIDGWKKSLLDEKEKIQKSLDSKNGDEESTSYQKNRLEVINYYLDNDIKPVENWKFNAFNYLKDIIQSLGLIILVSGIAVFMSDMVSGESTPPTLKFLLVQPISRGKVILSKFISVVITVVGMICGLELIAFGIVGVIGGFDGANIPQIIHTAYQFDYSNLDPTGNPMLSEVVNSGITATRGGALLQIFGMQVLFIIACCAFVFLISAIFKSSMTTMALSVIISVASTMACMVSGKVGKIAHLIFLNYGRTDGVIDGSICRVFNNPNFNINLGIGLMLGTIICSYVIAHIVFSKKDILI
ncbi:ABC transporter permease subunit [Clostridium sp. SHJSY1]|uniref:ABC transporter permease subunit n=1 Tax=Clostridium sp. SHJSY1 TaxID=2942483 RepID=UPI002876D3B8|nr:ABC transporter permease subunit [Clostridium sp. SHJSY1]MDS0527245.1 ABC transporter permease subunit [Clostridium sp. SHJSY1]